MTVDFRERAASALTHPLTLASLGTLLLNDIVLKRLWSGAWVPGKLSDLAWMVFAPPLLAYLLSLAVPRRQLLRVERAGFAVAYVGLPLLYAAFNTFPPVHGAILSGLALVGGNGLGSPLDATDSLVIPFAMAVALWVWNRRLVDVDAVRARLTLLTMAVAVLASVATSPSPTDVGVTEIESVDGIIYAKSTDRYGGNLNCYASDDGRLSWKETRCLYDSEPGIASGPVVETPRGRYEVTGSEIVRLRGGLRETVYSAAYLGTEPNVWQQSRMTRALGLRELTTAPQGILYDAQSSNLIVAMGLQGVVVGTPDDAWTRIAVGRYAPTDFSFGSKVNVLREGVFIWAALALSLSFANLALTLALAYMEKGAKTVSPSPVEAQRDPFGGMSLTAAFDDLVNAVFSPRGLAWASAGLAVLAVLVGGVYPSFSTEEAGVLGDPDGAVMGRVLAVFALLGAVGGLLISGRSWRQMSAVAVAVAGMFLLAALWFMLWLQSNLLLVVANLVAVGLVALAAFALWGYLVCSEGKPDGNE